MSKLIDIKAELETLLPYLGNSTQGEALKFAIKVMDERIELEEDKHRLDLLEKSKCAYFHEGPCCWRINEDESTDSDTLREAIDKIMSSWEAEGKP